MKANFGILPPVEGRGRRDRSRAHAARSEAELEKFLQDVETPLRIST
jgi:hypothetical protein